MSGFDAFGDIKHNPTEALVKSLPAGFDFKNGRAVLHGVVLPTCCKKGWRKLRNSLSELKPDMLVLTGLANDQNRLLLERFALNVRDYPIKDNGGHKYDGEQIISNGPEARRTEVLLNELRDHLQQTGYPCKISYHAGAFVCNDIYYQALSYQPSFPKLKIVLFVHVPLPEALASAALKKFPKRTHPDGFESKRKLQMQFMLEGVLEIARFCAESHR